MNLLTTTLLGAASIWFAFEIYSFSTEISAASLNNDLPDSWTVVETTEGIKEINSKKDAELDSDSFVAGVIDDNRIMIHPSL
jgi:hypothetical protein